MGARTFQSGILVAVAMGAGMLSAEGLHRARAQSTEALAQPAPIALVAGSGKMMRWEYKFLDPNEIIEPTQLGVWSRGSGISDPKLAQAVNKLGDQGFELILVDKHGLYFRRPKD